MPRTRVSWVILGIAVLASAGGCPPGGSLFGGVTVQVVNDTDFPIEGDVRYDDEDDFFSSLFGGDTAPTGLLDSGEVFELSFDCDSIAVVATADVQQFDDVFDSVADDSGSVSAEDDFDCGDVIRFRFVGEGPSFGVIVSVNGRVIATN